MSEKIWAGARWEWNALCPNGHKYGNFSGGADPCYSCGADPIVVFDGDDSAKRLAEWMAGCHEKMPNDYLECTLRKGHDGNHSGTRWLPESETWSSDPTSAKVGDA